MYSLQSVHQFGSFSVVEVDVCRGRDSQDPGVVKYELVASSKFFVNRQLKHMIMILRRRKVYTKYDLIAAHLPSWDMVTLAGPASATAPLHINLGSSFKCQLTERGEFKEEI